MRFLANISPTLKLTRRLSCNANVLRYTSLVKVLQCQRYGNSVMSPNVALKRYYCVDKSDKSENLIIKIVNSAKLKDRVFQGSQNNEHVETSNLVVPMALLDLNPQSSKSTKVLLIPFNWQNADDKTMGNVISSIFAKRTNLRQIEAFSKALREVSNLQKDSEKEAKKNEEISKQLHNSQEICESQNCQKEKQDIPSAESSLMSVSGNNMVQLDRLAADFEKALQQYCLHSMQMSVDVNFFGGEIKGLKFRTTPREVGWSEETDERNFTVKTISKGRPLSLSTIMQIDASKLNLEEISWNKSYPFPEMQTSSLTNLTFPINMTRKSFSTRSTTANQQNSKSPNISSKRYGDEDLSFKEHSNVSDMTPKRNVSQMSAAKCNANYDFPFLSNLFGTKELLLSCDAYNKALVEADKRRLALANCTAELKNMKDDVPSRLQVTSVKGCSAPSHKNISDTYMQPSEPCPPPVKRASQGGCKKDDPCKSTESTDCTDPCKDEMEKLERQEIEDAKSKKNKMPIGCVSPKCKKDDACSKQRKSPCKKASGQENVEQLNYSNTSENPAVKHADGGCKKNDPCKPSTECPNPCKDELEKMERLEREDAKRKRNRMPTGCVSPKCKKDDACSNTKKTPCKKASETNIASAHILQCAKSGENKGKSNSCGKGKNQKNKKNPCADDHKEYEPKCNTDPCKKESESCGDKKKKEDGSGGCKKKEDPSKKKKSEPCGGDKKKEDPCKKKKSDPCGGDKKKEDPCKKKKSDPCGGDKKKEDPCKKKKSDPCGGDKKKEDPCKKKSDPCGGDKKKEDPCKKKKSDPCGADKKKEDPCKKKPSDPCGADKKKEDPCKKSDPCGGSKKKEEPCGGSKKQEDPCMKKEKSPCKKKEDPSKKKCSSDDKCKTKKSESSGCSKQESKRTFCGNPPKDTKPNCGKNTTKRTFTSLTYLPTLRNKNMHSFGFMRHFSSKGGKKDKDINQGRVSQCKSLGAVIPPKRTPAYNPHPKEGLRNCYPSYDMECKKLCKDPRETACKKFAFLKNTEDNKRSGKK